MNSSSIHSNTNGEHHFVVNHRVTPLSCPLIIQTHNGYTKMTLQPANIAYQLALYNITLEGAFVGASIYKLYILHLHARSSLIIY